MSNQSLHQGKKLHYMIKQYRTDKVRCIQKDCKKYHSKSLIITLACGCMKVFNDKVLGWTSFYGTKDCKTRRHGNRK